MPEGQDLPRRKYNWSQWNKELADGRAWVAYRGGDYQCLSTSFASTLRRLAAENGKKATIQVFDSCVVFAFFDAKSYWKPNMPALKDVRRVRRSLGLD